MVSIANSNHLSELLYVEQTMEPTTRHLKLTLYW